MAATMLPLALILCAFASQSVMAATTFDTKVVMDSQNRILKVHVFTMEDGVLTTVRGICHAYDADTEIGVFDGSFVSANAALVTWVSQAPTGPAYNQVWTQSSGACDFVYDIQNGVIIGYSEVCRRISDFSNDVSEASYTFKSGSFTGINAANFKTLQLLLQKPVESFDPTTLNEVIFTRVQPATDATGNLVPTLTNDKATWFATKVGSGKAGVMTGAFDFTKLDGTIIPGFALPSSEILKTKLGLVVLFDLLVLPRNQVTYKHFPGFTFFPSDSLAVQHFCAIQYDSKGHLTLTDHKVCRYGYYKKTGVNKKDFKKLVKYIPEGKVLGVKVDK